MKTIEIILIALAVAFGVFVYVKAFTVYCILELITNVIVLPIDFLLGVDNPLGELGFTKDSFRNRGRRDTLLPFSRSIKAVAMFVVFGISLIYVIKNILGPGSFYDAMQMVIDNLPIMVLTSALSDGLFSLDFISYAGLIASAFSSFLAMVYMRYTVDTLNEQSTSPIVYWPIVVIFNIVFTFMSCMLCQELTPWFGRTANGFISFFQGLKETAKGLNITGFFSFFKFIGTWLAVIAITYLAFATLVVFVREYLAAIMYGVFAIALLIVVGLVTQEWLALPSYVTSIAMLAALFVSEYIRIAPEANDRFKEFMLDLSFF